MKVMLNDGTVADAIPLRDELAARALPVAFTLYSVDHQSWVNLMFEPGDHVSTEQCIARLSYRIADAMIAEGEKK